MRVVSTVSNADTITHYVGASLKVLRRVERDLARRYPSADTNSRTISMAVVAGRDHSGLSVLTRGLRAIAAAGLEAIGASQGPRNVDVLFTLERDSLKPAIAALHRALVEAPRPALARDA